MALTRCTTLLLLFLYTLCSIASLIQATDVKYCGFPIRPTLKGEQLDRALQIFDIPFEGRDVKTLLSPGNLLRFGFLKQGVRGSSVQRSATAPRNKKRAHKEMAGKVPPFMQTTPSGPSRKNAVGSGKPPSGSALEVAPKRADPQLDDRSPNKRLRIVSNPPPSTSGSIGKDFLRLTSAAVPEADLAVWDKRSLEDSSAAATRALGEVFFHQIKHDKEIRLLSSQVRKLQNSVTVHKAREQAAKDEADQVIVKMKLSHREEVKVLNGELRDLKARVDEFKAAADKAREDHAADLVGFNARVAELQARIATLEAGDVTFSVTPTESQVQEAEARGSVNFMKSFMQHIPDFDWSQMGAATAEFAANLKKEMDEEAAAKRPEEEEARRADP